jgi:hypothetical protein
MMLELLNMVKSWNRNKEFEIQILQDDNNMKKGNKETDGIIQVKHMFKRRTSYMVLVGLEKRAPTWPLTTKGSLVKSSCVSADKLLAEPHDIYIE